jgi:hypothetical protein
MKMWNITLTDVIIMILVLLVVGGITTCSIYKERSKMSVEVYRGMEGFTVDAESVEDVYNALDGMHTQSMDNLGENHKMTMWLADKMDELHQKFDLDEEKLMCP